MKLFASFVHLALVLALAWPSSLLAAQTGQLRSIASIETADASVPTGQFDELEAQLLSELDRQADAIFREFKASPTSVELEAFEHAKRIAIYRLKQMNVVSDLLKAAGPAPATALITAEILTTFVLAPIATAMGKPAVAGVMVAVPWGMVAGFGVFWYQSMAARVKLARQFGLMSLGSLDRIRDLVIGYDLKYRVASIIYKSLETDLGPLEFEVLKNSVKSTKAPAVTLNELEDLVRASTDGPAFLQKVYLEKLDSPYYASLLLRFINENVATTEQLVSLVESRLPLSREKSALRRHLLGVSDVRMMIARELKTAQARRKLLKKQLKAGAISKAEAVAMKDHFQGEMVRLRELRQELVHHEYQVLLDVRLATENAGMDLETVAVSDAFTKTLADISMRAKAEEPQLFEKAKPAFQPAREGTRAAAVGPRALVCAELF